LVGGLWSISGTKRADVISVERDPNNHSMLRAIINGKVVDTRSDSAVHKIQLQGLAGNDTLKIDESHGAIRTDAVLLGGQGKNKLVGGSGVTLLNGGNVKQSLLVGGAGRTTFKAGIVADSITKFGSASALRKFLGHSATSLNNAFGRFKGGGALAAAPSPSGGQTASDPSHSTTNVQVAGVDEADIVKTDGNYVYLISRGELLIVDAKNASAPSIASRTTIDGYPISEYLDGNRLTVLSTVWNPGDTSGSGAGTKLASPSGFASLWFRGTSRVQVTTFDVTDATKPTVVRQTSIDGSYSDSRMVDGKLYLVLQADLFSGFWQGGPIAIARTKAGASSLSKPSSLANAPIDKILPSYSSKLTTITGTVTSAGLISQPSDIYHPADGSDANLMSIVVLDSQGNSAAPLGTASVLGSYASTLHVTSDSLYVFSPRWDDGTSTTSISQFSITSANPTLVATGIVPGSLINQYAADESNGYLRVATTNWDGNGPANGLYVLQTDGTRLNVVGAVDNITPGEALQSVRFDGDRAYLVTFKQVDPLIAVDLSNPANPQIAGELIVPGYSSYLQPIGKDYLIGIGRDANPDTGQTTDIKLSLFNVHDLSHPSLIASQSIVPVGTQWNWSNAEWDPHAFGWFPELNVLAVPVQGYGEAADGTWTSNSDLYVFKIDTSAGTKALQTLGNVTHDSSVQRSVRIENVIYSIADQDIQTVQINATNLSALGKLTIQTDTGGGGIVF
jgi:uncharacterized secreted protein with C-terminal beta-propeller domain